MHGNHKYQAVHRTKDLAHSPSLRSVWNATTVSQMVGRVSAALPALPALPVRGPALAAPSVREVAFPSVPGLGVCRRGLSAHTDMVGTRSAHHQHMSNGQGVIGQESWWVAGVRNC